MMRVALVDLDGTLSNASHRLDLLPNWDAFHQASIDDAPVWDVINLVNCLSDCEVVVITERPEKARPITEEWLARYKVRYDRLLMRSDNDFRTSIEVKDGFLSEIGAGNRVWFVLEDRDKIAALYRSKGLTVLQTKEGEA